MDTSHKFLLVKFSQIPLDREKCENYTPTENAYIDQALVVATSENFPLLNGVTTPISWLIYEYSEIIEQRMIPGGSNNEMLTDVGSSVLTRNCKPSGAKV